MPELSAFLPLVAIVLVLATSVAVALVVSTMKDDTAMRRRVSQAVVGRQVSASAPVLIVKKPKKTLESQLVSSLPGLQGVRRRLRRAGVNISITNYAIVMLALSVVALLLIPENPIPGSLMVLLVPIGVYIVVDRIVVGFLVARARSKMLGQMPLAIDMIVRAVRVGQSLDASLKNVAAELEPPLGLEFKRLIGLLNAGTNIVEALDAVGEEINLREFDFFVAACRVQLETGGNLADALQSLSETIRERHNLRLKIKALSAEGKISAVIISAMPVLLLLYFNVANPEYIDPLYSRTFGNYMLIGAFALIAAGGAVMAKMVRIRI